MDHAIARRSGEATWSRRDEERPLFEAANRSLARRRYLLFSGAVESLVREGEHQPHRSPQLWRPESREWFVWSEVDFGLSVVAGDDRLATALHGSHEFDTDELGWDEVITEFGDESNSSADPR